MASLLETERRVTESLLGADHGAAASLIAADRFSPAQHLNVYRNNVQSSLRAAIGDIYSVVARLVGEDFFRVLAREYVRAHPSSSANLHDLGVRLPEFLETFGPARSLPYLPDVARLERAWHEVFHAPDATPLEPARITAALEGDPGELRGRVHPASRLLESVWPILRILQVNQDDAPGKGTVSLERGGDRLLVIRPGLEVEIRPLSAGELELLRALLENRRITEACAAALAAEPGLDLPATLQRYLADGVIVGLGR